jgi:hypothetical protein
MNHYHGDTLTKISGDRLSYLGMTVDRVPTA